MWKFHFFYCCYCCCRHRCWCYLCCFSCTLLVYSSLCTLQLNLHRESSFLSFICPWALSLHYTLIVSPSFDMFVAKLALAFASSCFFSLVRVHSIGAAAAAAAVATLFMSHIRNAYSKRSNFLHQCFKHTPVRVYVCVCIMVVFSFNYY